MSAARILPPEEWDRLGDAADLYRTMNPEDAAVIVVENGGAIVARLAVLRVPHFESLWLAPEAIGNAGIARAMVRAATKKAAEWAPHWIMANADNDATCKLLERIGGHWLPVHTFLLPLQRVEMEEACHKPLS